MLAKKSVFAAGAEQAPNVWKAIKLIYPFQIAAFIPPLVTAAVVPMILSSQVGEVSMGGQGRLGCKRESSCEAAAPHPWSFVAWCSS